MPVYQNRSVGRVLSILELLGNTSKALTLTEIARSVNLDASTAYRALRALCERGFVYRIEATRRYVLSYNAFRLGSPDRVVQGINNRARMIMVRLAKEVNETIRLAVLEGAEARFCAEAGVARPGLRMLGAMVDAHASAAGKALIAWRSRADIELLYRGRSMHAYSERTIRNVPMLVAELAEVRARGWAVSEGEGLRPDDRGLAVPCFDSQRPCALFAGDRLDPQAPAAEPRQGVPVAADRWLRAKCPTRSACSAPTGPHLPVADYAERRRELSARRTNRCAANRRAPPRSARRRGRRPYSGARCRFAT